MKKNILLITTLSGALCGCVSQPPVNGVMFGETGTLNVTGCDIQVETPCDDSDVNNPKVELNLDTWELKPECVEAKKGKIITVTLKSSQPIDKGTVVVFPKEVENYFWLAKTNSPNKNKIRIKVKEKKPSGKDLPEGIYRYGIWTEEKCIDPRVDVKN